MYNPSYRAAVIAIAAIVSSVACGAESSSSVEEFTAACNTSMNTGPDICRCVAENAQRDLSPKGFAFLTAAMQKDDAKTAELRGSMGFEELTAASMYMLNGPKNCAQP